MTERIDKKTTHEKLDSQAISQRIESLLWQVNSRHKYVESLWERMMRKKIDKRKIHTHKGCNRERVKCAEKQNNKRKVEKQIFMIKWCEKPTFTYAKNAACATFSFLFSFQHPENGIHTIENSAWLRGVYVMFAMLIHKPDNEIVVLVCLLSVSLSLSVCPPICLLKNAHMR